MRLDTTMTQRLDQRMILAPRMIQSMEILQLPIMALQERIQQELQENPVLELREDSGEEGAADADDLPAVEREDDGGDREQELVIDDSGDNSLDFDRLETLSRDYEDQFNEDYRASRNGLDEESDKKHDAMQNMASRPQSLQDYLNDQLSFLDVKPDLLKRVRYLISHVDGNGRLTTRLLEDLVPGFGTPVTVAE